MDVIIGNPPFLGWFKLRKELGDKYVNNLRMVYEDQVPGGADLVTYWFERSRNMIEGKKAKRAGLLATNSIRGGANRKVLENIKKTTDIFWAISDQEWILDGAAVRVSMIGFGEQYNQKIILDNKIVQSISSDLGGALDFTTAKQLAENAKICYLGAFKFGAFDIEERVAREMLNSPNPNGQPNSDVIMPWVNGLDITRRPRKMWIINFGSMPLEQAAQYELPFEYVKTHVKPFRDANRRKKRRVYWWQHGETSPGLYTALNNLNRYIGMARVAKHRLFVWLKYPTVPDMQVIVFAREDDYFYGILHSKIHELWALRQGTSLEDRPRYTPTTTFETFPFPWPPGAEPVDDPRVRAIAQAAQELVEQRERWLTPSQPPPNTTTQTLNVDSASTPSYLGEVPEGRRGSGSKKRTLTNLYNARPTWLELAHKKLDEAVFAAYGWPSDLSDEEILEKLLALNLERSKSE